MVTRYLLLGVLPMLCAAPQSLTAQEKERGTDLPKVLAHAHAHNDYYHKRPLLDALELGFRSIEADVLLIGGRLLVGHSRLEVRTERDLQQMYLDPLLARFQRHGKLFADGSTMILLIDFKSDAEASYASLKSILEDYKSMLMRLENGKLIPGAVQVIISGNRPVDTLRAESSRLAFIDGRMGDLKSNSPVELIPLISDNWYSQFKWNGLGQMPAGEVEKLRSLLQEAHQQKRLVRFWNSPDHPTAWQMLYDQGVDLINTDKLDDLATFLRQR